METAPADVIARRMARREARPELAAITPLAISGYWDGPKIGDVILRYVFPMGGVIKDLNVCVTGTGFKNATVSVSVSGTVERTLMLPVLAGIPSGIDVALPVAQFEILTVKLLSTTGQDVSLVSAWVAGIFQIDGSYLSRKTLGGVEK
jgi:hypothetical protein